MSENALEDEEHRLYERLHQIQNLITALERERDEILTRLGAIGREA